MLPHEEQIYLTQKRFFFFLQYCLRPCYEGNPINPTSRKKSEPLCRLCCCCFVLLLPA